MERVVYRRPLGFLVPMAIVLALLALVRPRPGSWTYVVVVVVLLGAIAARQRMVLTDEGVEVTLFGTRRIPWAQVRGFRAASHWRGGVYVLTQAGGQVWSPAPGRWWSGAASEADVAALEGIRARR